MAVEANSSQNNDMDIERRKNLKKMLQLTAGAAILTQTDLFSYLTKLLETSGPIVSKLNSRIKAVATQMELDGDLEDLRKMYLFATSIGSYRSRQIRTYTIKSNARKIGFPEDIVRGFNPENNPYKQFFSEKNRILTYTPDQENASMRLYDVDVQKLSVYKEMILRKIRILESKSS